MVRLFQDDLPYRDLKQSSFDLVPVDSPVGVRVFFSTVEFEIRAGAYLFDKLAKSKWLLAVLGPWFHLPTRNIVATERQTASHREDKELMRQSPIIPYADGGLHPNEARLVFESPRSHDTECGFEERVRCPEV